MFVRSVEVIGKNAWYAALFLPLFLCMHLFIVSPLILMVKAAKISQYVEINSEAKSGCYYST